MVKRIVKRDRKKGNWQEHLILEGELKCIWMTAGVVSYKLCNYQYECERCPFDRVLRGGSNASVGQDRSPNEDSDFRTIPIEKISQGDGPGDLKGSDFEGIFKKFYDVRIKRNLFYHRGHTWADVDDPDHIRMGIDDFAGRFILGTKMVVLPTRGNKIDQGQVCCWIVEEEGPLPIVAPLTGAVVTVNPQLSEDPGLVNRSPYGKGWLMKIKPENLRRDLKYLYSEDAVIPRYKRDIERLRKKFESLLRENWENLGPRLCDGGNMFIHLRDMIGQQRYFDIISAFFTGK
ncbi:MAG: glycine cleavage system protein H [bacterium]